MLSEWNTYITGTFYLATCQRLAIYDCLVMKVSMHNLATTKAYYVVYKYLGQAHATTHLVYHSTILTFMELNFCFTMQIMMYTVFMYMI